MMNSGNEYEIDLTGLDLSRLSAPEKAAIESDLKELDRRQHEEQLRYMQLAHPGMINPNFPDIPVNDQIGFYNSPAKIRYLGGGNRASKTQMGSYDVLKFGLGEHPVRSLHRKPPVHVRICAPDYEKNCKGVILKKFRTLIPHFQLKGSSWVRAWSEKSAMLSLTNGSTYNFKSYEMFKKNPLSFGGDDIDAFWNDEHAPYDAFVENMARTTDRNGYGLMTMTPEEGQTWEWDYLTNPPPGISVAYWFFDSRGNPYLSKEGVEALMAELRKNPALFEAKIKGMFVALTGLVFQDWDPNKHIIRDFPIPAHWSRAVIIDAHLRKPTAVLWLTWGDDDDVYAYRALKIKGTVKEIADIIRKQSAGEKITDFIGDEAMDGSGQNIYGQDSVLEQFRKEGIPVQPSGKMKDDTFFRASIYKIRDLLKFSFNRPKPGFMLFESADWPMKYIEGYMCGSLNWEMRRLRFRKETSVDEETFREKIVNVDDDLISCLRYGVMNPPVKYAPTVDTTIAPYGTTKVEKSPTVRARKSPIRDFLERSHDA